MGKQQAGLRVFVMGCSRGGTTLTQRLIAERLNLYTLPETRFFASLIGNLEQRMFPATRRATPLVRRYSSALRERLGLSTGMEYKNVTTLPVQPRRKWSPVSKVGAEFVATLDAAAMQAGCRGWLEKTPFHLHYAPQIAKLVPGAWMVHVIRDPQETIASLWDVARRYPASWGVTYDRLDRAVDNWNATVRDSAAMVGRPRQIFVPYAALAAAPEAVLDRIAAEIGVAGNGAAETRRVAFQLAGQTENWKKAAVDGPVRPAVSKWTTALSEAERRQAGALIHPVPAVLTAAMAPFAALVPDGGTSPLP